MSPRRSKRITKNKNTKTMSENDKPKDKVSDMASMKTPEHSSNVAESSPETASNQSDPTMAQIMEAISALNMRMDYMQQNMEQSQRTPERPQHSLSAGPSTEPQISVQRTSQKNAQIPRSTESILDGISGDTDVSRPLFHSLPANDRALPAASNIPRNPVGSSSGERLIPCNIPNTMALPLYDLPEFDGLPEKWPVFIAAFLQSTQAFGYSALQNIFRLQKCLKGEARDAVEYLLMNPNNVDELIDTLEFRFGRPEILVQTQIHKIRTLPDITERHIEQLIPFSTRVTNLVAFLNTNASRHVLYESTLLADLVSKLPPNKRLEWVQHSIAIRPRPNAVDFAVWLRGIAECVGILSSQLSHTQQNTNHYSGKRLDKHVLNVQHMPSQTNCAICSEAHDALDCDQFKKEPIINRRNIAERLRLCYGCLQTNHSFENCETKIVCPISGCNLEHNVLLHIHDTRNGTTYRRRKRSPRHPAIPASTVNTSEASPNQRRNPFSKDVSFPAIYHLTGRKPEGQLPLYRILPITVYGPNGQFETYALLDEGSAITIIDERLSEHLGLKGPHESLNVKWIGQHVTSQSSQVVEIEISGASQRKFTLNKVRTIKNISLPTQSVTLSHLDERLRNLPIAEYTDATPLLLIGLDNCHLAMARHTVTTNVDGPIAAKTILGWVLYGPQNKPATSHVLHIADAGEWEHLDKTMKEYFSIDNFGVKKPEKIIESDEDSRARQLLQLTTKRVGDRFQSGLLWRSGDIIIPNSFDMARKRLTSILGKMRRDPEYARLYAAQINAYVQKGYARQLSAEEIQLGDRIWYLPHFGVQTINKPGKLRLVFDAAATAHGISLNSLLLKGPDLNQPLINILFRFRQHKIAVCGDIAEMFHQIQIQPCDRSSQRFLWSNDNGRTIDIYEMCVMTFGATCSPTTAQYVKNLNADQYEEEHPAATKAIREQHYVDDFVASFATEEEAIKVTSTVTEIHKLGGFVLRGFVSNSSAVLKSLGVTSGNIDEIDLEFDVGSTEKILGMRWHTMADSFVFAMRFDRVDNQVMNGTQIPTKRQLLSAAMSVFDPFGFLSNFMVHSKTMMQALWRLGVAWDEKVPNEIYRRWQAWCHELEQIKKFRIPRCYSLNIFLCSDLQLHLFADASEEAFAAVAYWRISNEGSHEVSFIAGKVKCAPLKLLTVPRLELQAAVLATRLCNTIKECHPDIKVRRTVFWTDSSTVQHWILSTLRRYRPFVAHRVSEILDSTEASWWRWLPTEENVADDATRSRNQPKFDPSSRWLRGPAFLTEDENRWPQSRQVLDPDTFTEDPEELASSFVGVVSVSENALIDTYEYSSFLRLRRAFAWALRFIHNSRAKFTNTPRKSGELDTYEIQTATDHLCIEAQRSRYPDEYANLSNNKAIDKSSSILTLMPYMDANKLIRLYGRTDAAERKYLPIEAQRPILLPRDHRLTELIIDHYHQRMGHQFEDGIICAIRQRYWVPCLRPLVRRIKLRCNFCKVRAARPNPPIAGQLPPDRLTPFIPPFHFTGMDFFGPVSVTIGRRNEKRWIALFTCLTTRAIHMEVAENLSTDACLLVIKNFCNLRGVPARIRSDCGTNFVGADNEIRRTADFIEPSTIQRDLSTNGIEWLMNCPGNPEAGGAWERMVQSTKKILAVTLKQISPHVETLRSLVIEAANLINSLPLTNVPVNLEDLEPLTPNHFLLGRANITTTYGNVDPKPLCSRKQWRIQQQLMRHFWRRWIDDYLPELTRRTKFYKEVGPVAEGALVLVCDTNLSHRQWIRGRVESVTIGTDGRVRTAAVRTSRGLIRRPVSKLAILDVESESR